jgi:hypothetical protein
LRIGQRVQMAMKAAPNGDCFLYLTWDRSGLDSNNHTRFQSRLARLTVTTDPSGSTCAPDSSFGTNGFITGQFQTFSPSVVADYYSNNVGWFHYTDQDGDNHCATTFTGWFATALDFSGRQSITLSESNFPNIIVDMNNGIGDSNATVPFGLFGGSLFPSWAVPVTTTSSQGILCNGAGGSRFNLRVNGRTGFAH